MAAVCIGLVEHGEISTGEWCDHCSLPSAVSFDVLMVTVDGVSTIGRATVCVECGEFE